MKAFLFFVLIFSTYNCFSQEKDPNVPYFSCQVIEKPFVIKNGVESDRMEYYLRCSVDDYFIKFCESSVSRKEIEEYVGKGIMVDVEIREGSWDICSGDLEYAQSRIGYYAVIHQILERE